MGKSSRKTPEKPKVSGGGKFDVPADWTFKDPKVAKAFDSHVREQLPWYDLATGAVAHFARHYVPRNGTVIDVGASTGNIGRALDPMLKSRSAELVAIDNAREMAAVYEGPGQFIVEDVTTFDFDARKPDLIVCFLALMFVAIPDRQILIGRMRRSLRAGGALIVFDKMLPRDGFLGTVNYRLTLAAKYEAGAPPADIIAKELSISGLQRPMSANELSGFAEVFRFGDFAGWVFEA